MKLLISIIRFLYKFFVTYSSAIISVAAIFIVFDIDSDYLETYHIAIAFFINLVILDLFFFENDSFFRDMFWKKEEVKCMTLQQSVGRSLRTNRVKPKVNFSVINDINKGEGEEHY